MTMSRPCTCRNCCHFAALPGSDYCDGCERIAAIGVAAKEITPNARRSAAFDAETASEEITPAARPPAAALAAKLARIDALAVENIADWRPSFVALLAGAA